MQIALLTPWLVKCGLSSYSYYLAHALAELGCESKVVRLSRFGTRDEAYYRNYAEEVSLDVDLISVQHEYGLLQWMELPFYQALRNRLTMFGREDVPIVTTMHATGNLRPDRTIRQFSDAVIVHNVFGAKQFKFPCTVIPMGVQKVTKKVDSELAKRRWNVKGKTVGFFGFISEYKGLEILIRVLSGMENVSLIVGGGWHIDTKTPYMMSIQSYAARLMPKRTRWIGYVQEEDMPYFFSACDVMFFGHHFISESMSLLTALAHGKATVASNMPAFNEKKPAVLTFKDGEDLKGKINALLNEPELRQMMEQNALKYAQKFSWENSAKMYIELFQKLIEQKKEAKT